MRKQLRIFTHLCGELNVVRLDSWVRLFEFGDEVFVLVDENSTALLIEREPEQGFVGEAENEEIGFWVLKQSSGDGG